MAKRAQLVTQHLENISRTALRDYQHIVREYLRGRQGIYALYRRGRLYYVGLASSLRGRLNTHLRDRHGQSWDRFSVYLTIGDKHLRELEALVLRIVDPPGNKQKGKFAKSENLIRRFRREVKALLLKELKDVTGDGHKSKKRRTSRGDVADQKGVPALAKYVDGPLTLRAEYKGKTFRARVLKSGMVKFDGVSYKSPSGAGKAVRNRATNGWAFWHYKTKSGKWVPLKQLKNRKRKLRTKKKTKKRRKKSKASSSLAKYIKHGFRIRAKHKGRTIRARVLKNGSISYGGTRLGSLSRAASAATGRATNGWTFWTYERSPGDWVPLKALRR